MTYIDGQLRPRSPEGGRWVAAAEALIEPFRARADAHDAAGTFPHDNLADLRAAGLLGALIPAELGGMGVASVHDWLVGLERLGRGDASTALALNMHLTVTRNLVLARRGALGRNDGATVEAMEDLLRAVVDGKLVISATATEAGTDFLRPRTTARRDGDGWVLSGRKMFVTMSPAAQLYVVGVRVEDGAEPKLGFAFVPATAAGLHPQGDWDALGMRASASESVVFEDCHLDGGAVQVAGEWGKWNAGVLMGRTVSNVLLVGVFLGIAERARELAVAAARSTTKAKSDGPIATASGVQHLLGEIDIDLAAARATLADAASRLDVFLQRDAVPAPTTEDAHACMRDYQCAKWIVNQAAIRIVSRAMDIAGGGAYLRRNELSRLYRDVRAGPFMQPFSPTEAREYVGQIAVGLYPTG